VGTLLEHETAERKRSLSLDASDGLDALDFRWLDRRAFCGANVTLCCSVFALARSADLDRDDYHHPFRAPQAWSPHGVCNSGGAFMVRFAEHVNIGEIDCDRGARFFCVFGFCRIGRISSVVCSIANCFGKGRDDRHLRRRNCSCALCRVTSKKAGCAKVGSLKGRSVGRGRPPPRERRASHHITILEQLTRPARAAPVPFLVGRTGVDLEFVVAHAPEFYRLNMIPVSQADLREPICARWHHHHT
jgi:hypothetical protein